MRDTELIIEKIKLINFKYEEVLRLESVEFNIFSILRNEHDEVYLHSNFICELLNPDGTHGKNSTFLELFNTEMGIENFSYENVRVEKEYKNIDIYITNNRQSIIIENKINAVDQDKQLERYQKIIKEEGIEEIFIIYLTLHGSKPNKKSIGNINENMIRLCSYRENIDAWLENCINVSSIFPTLRETLFQYKKLIQKLTGKSFNKGQIMEATEILKDEEALKAASTINKAFKELKVSIQLSFWKDLEEELAKKGINAQKEYKYSNKLIQDYYNKSRNKKYYGILTKISDLGENGKLYYGIELANSVYHGFCIQSTSDEWDTNKNKKFDEQYEIIQSIDSSYKRTQYWLGWKYTSPELNFMNFSDENIFMLVNKKKRKALIHRLASEVYNSIESFKNNSIK